MRARKSSRAGPPGEDPVPEVDRQQILAFRLARLGLGARRRTLAAAVGEVGLSDFPPGAALQALPPRLSSASPTSLDRAYRERSLVRVRAMRGAPVVIAPGDLPLFTGGLLPPDERAMRAFIGPALKSLAASNISALAAVERVTEETRRILGTALVDRDALHASLRGRLPPGLLPYCRGCDSHHVHPSLLYAVALRAPLVVFPRADGPYLLGLAGPWLDAQRADSPPDRVVLAAELLRRFLRAYAPSAIGDFAAWAGIGGGQPQATWAMVAPELRAVRVTGASARAPRFVLGGDLAALTASEADPSAVRLLSPGDPLLQMRDRQLLCDDPKVQKVIWKNLAPTGVLLVGSRLAGIVRSHKQKDTLRVEVQPVGKVDRQARTAAEVEAQRLAAVRGCGDLQLTWR